MADIQKFNEISGSIILIKMTINTIDEIIAKRMKEEDENAKNLREVFEENSGDILTRMKLMLEKAEANEEMIGKLSKSMGIKLWDMDNIRTATNDRLLEEESFRSMFD
jgi:hypothetical protein